MFRPKFNRSLRVESAPGLLSSELGALALREAAEELGLDEVLSRLYDPRDPAHVTYPLGELVRLRLFLLGQGRHDQDDADALRADPALRAAVVGARGCSGLSWPLASQPTMSRLMEVLSRDYNRDVLSEGLLEGSLRRAAQDRSRAETVTVDVDGFPVVAHGHQEGAAYNGYYEDVVFYPLLAVLDTGDLLAADLRAGNASSAADVVELLELVLDGVQQQYDDVWVRFDAGFADGELFDWLDARRVRWVGRLKSNSVLTRKAARFRERTSARWARTRVKDAELREETFEFYYQAQSWTRARRVVAVLVEHRDTDGTVHDEMFFLCTNAARPKASSAALLQRYRLRGCAEARIGDLVGDILPNLSSHEFERNEALLRLSALAYELAHILRRKLEKHQQQGLSLRRLREQFLALPAVCVRHARTVTFRLGLAAADAWRLLASALSPSPPPLQPSLSPAEAC